MAERGWGRGVRREAGRPEDQAHFPLHPPGRVQTEELCSREPWQRHQKTAAIHQVKGPFGVGALKSSNHNGQSRGSETQPHLFSLAGLLARNLGEAPWFLASPLEDSRAGEGNPLKDP